jgi:hypothetical protein
VKVQPKIEWWRVRWTDPTTGTRHTSVCTYDRESAHERATELVLDGYEAVEAYQTRPPHRKEPTT